MALSLCFHPSSPLLSSPVRRQHTRNVRFPKFRAGVKVGSGETAVVWFRNDLRIDDHPGLTEAVEKHGSVIPLYVFDPCILSDYSDLMLELLLFALKDLKSTLRIKGSDLLFRLGNAEDIIFKLVNEVKARHVFTEEAVEYDLRRLITNVENSFNSSSFSYGTPELVFWKAPLYEFKSLNEVPTSYNEFLRAKLSKSTLLPSPTLPPLNPELEKGNLPTLKEIKELIKQDASWTSIKKIRAKNVLKKIEKSSNENNKVEIDINTIIRRNKNANSFFASENSFEVRGGTDTVLEALAAYLRYVEGASRDDWQELKDKLRIKERENGASFSALFGPSIFLGTISKRRVFYEAIKYEKERNAGFISPFGYSAPTVTFSIETICSMEWYWLLALKSQISNEEKSNNFNLPIHIWRWNGYIIQYTVSGQEEGPAMLLIHGFGAFLHHFRDNITNISHKGHRVWAVTLIGFGKSEKPNMNYTELIWAEFVRDFIIEVVKEPVHLVGNSLGGYVASIVAGVWPSLVNSLALINTAGTVVPNYDFVPISKEWRSSYFSQLRAKLLLLFLRSSASSILKSYYPINQERVDEPLIKEMTRASYDPGAATVIDNIFNFNLSIPLNFLFDSFGGRVLIIQGTRDPLVKSEEFLSMLRNYCRNITLKELNAGHCAHDEIPNEVNLILNEWANKDAKIELAMKTT